MNVFVFFQFCLFSHLTVSTAACLNIICSSPWWPLNDLPQDLTTTLALDSQTSSCFFLSPCPFFSEDPVFFDSIFFSSSINILFFSNKLYSREMAIRSSILPSNWKIRFHFFCIKLVIPLKQTDRSNIFEFTGFVVKNYDGLEIVSNILSSELVSLSQFLGRR